MNNSNAVEMYLWKYPQGLRLENNRSIQIKRIMEDEGTIKDVTEKYN